MKNVSNTSSQTHVQQGNRPAYAQRLTQRLQKLSITTQKRVLITLGLLMAIASTAVLIQAFHTPTAVPLPPHAITRPMDIYPNTQPQHRSQQQSPYLVQDSTQRAGPM